MFKTLNYLSVIYTKRETVYGLQSFISSYCRWVKINSLPEKIIPILIWPFKTSKIFKPGSELIKAIKYYICYFFNYSSSTKYTKYTKYTSSGSSPWAKTELWVDIKVREKIKHLLKDYKNKKKYTDVYFYM